MSDWIKALRKTAKKCETLSKENFKFIDRMREASLSAGGE